MRWRYLIAIPVMAWAALFATSAGVLVWQAEPTTKDGDAQQSIDCTYLGALGTHRVSYWYDPGSGASLGRSQCPGIVWL